MFDAKENEDLFHPTNLEEFLKVLKSFAREKFLRPDGWTVEFFLHFFDIMGQHILEIMEESRTSGRISRAINSTFLELIPKSSNPKNFSDF